MWDPFGKKVTIRLLLTIPGSILLSKLNSFIHSFVAISKYPLVPTIASPQLTISAASWVTPAHREKGLRGSARTLTTYFSILPALTASAAAISLSHRSRLRVDAAIVLNPAEAKTAPLVDARSPMRTRNEARLALTVVASLGK